MASTEQRLTFRINDRFMFVDEYGKEILELQFPLDDNDLITIRVWDTEGELNFYTSVSYLGNDCNYLRPAQAQRRRKELETAYNAGLAAANKS